MKNIVFLILSSSWPSLGPSCTLLGISWALVGLLGPSWASLGRLLGISWTILGHLGPLLGLSWASLGHILCHLGPSRASLGHLLGFSRALLGILGPSFEAIPDPSTCFPMLFRFQLLSTCCHRLQSDRASRSLLQQVYGKL